MTLEISRSGILTTIQDLGRTGYRRFGINPNGVMDTTAARAINILLGNPEDEAVLELHFPAGEFKFEKACCFAIGGADFDAHLDGSAIENWSVHAARKGSVLTFSKRVLGSRSYLAFRGGVDVEEWLGSRSTNLMAGCGGFEGRKCQQGDRIAFRASSAAPPRRISRSLIPKYSRYPTVRVLSGPEFEWLTDESRDHFIGESYSVSNNSNRMGYRLSGVSLERRTGNEMISSAVTFGTIQLLPDGQLIILMADHQTTGGYPRIATVIAADLPLLAQIGPGDGVGFHIIPYAAAQDILLDLEREFNLLKIGCMFD